ncbi:urea carboxylase-associated family protein [Nocardiopsis sp. YSL2]|uniref:urea carboxylase-associated family protein n=1 Tax=Nocardiopsis sp. YSL2 TaxID=2939492 RepID=UPI0026F42574|nr:urea carboxylase-associated family protein [Nocardiopsis sp. YSL2]
MSTSSVRTVVPARHARSVRVEAGRSVRVVDTDGGQVGDVFAFVADDPAEYHSAGHTRAHLSRLFPRKGETFVTNRRRPLLTLVEDTSPGAHDMLVPACDPQRYADLGADPGHRSCAANLAEAAAAHGISVTDAPQPINVFMNIPVIDGTDIAWHSARSRPGDAITFRAELDCVVIVSACPQDLVGINGEGPTPLAIEVLDDPGRLRSAFASADATSGKEQL